MSNRVDGLSGKPRQDAVLTIDMATAITHADGTVTVSKTVKVTGKGQQYFVEKFLGGAA